MKITKVLSVLALAVSCYAQAPTVIQPSDTVSGSRVVINTNFSNLYNQIVSGITSAPNQVIFNNGGSVTGSNNFTWDGVANIGNIFGRWNISGILNVGGQTTFSALGPGIGHLSSGGVFSSSPVDLSGADVANNLPVARLNGGSGATTTTCWHGDATWGACGTVIQSSSYQFAPQTPGGSLVIGSNTVTFTPVPQGVNGTDVGHYIYISGGAGTPEACLIAGGSGTGGQTTGQIVLSCANTHSGAWTAASASSGLAEAICSLPSAGGNIAIATNPTLNANVSGCGKGSVSIAKQAGILITNAATYTILNQNAILEGNGLPVTANPPTPLAEYFSTNSAPQNAWYSGAFNGTKYRTYYLKQGPDMADGYMGPNTQDTMTMTMNVPFGAGAGYVGTFPTNAGQALGSYAITNDNRIGAIAAFGQGFCNSNISIATHAACWGGNFSGGTVTGSSGGESVFGGENDINIITPNALNAQAFFAGGGSQFQVTATSAAFWNHQMGGVQAGTVNTSGTAVTSVAPLFDPTWGVGTAVWINNVQYTVASVASPLAMTLSGSAGTQTGVDFTTATILPYKFGLYTDDGSAIWGVRLGTLQSATPQYTSSPSQFIQLINRNAGVEGQTLMFTNSSGEFVVSTQALGTQFGGGPVEVVNGYIKIPVYAFAARPSPVSPAGSIINITGATADSSPCTSGSANVLAHSDGTNWICTH